jgi:basic membrane lipoprotein Med (substrate-binding protein (PBP1-ABC) superfamily)
MLSAFQKSISILFSASLALYAAPSKDKIGFIYVGPKTDYGYNYAMDQGRMALEKSIPGVKTVFFENIPENAEVERVMERMASQGFGIIFPTSYGYLDPALKVAKKHLDITYIHAGGFKLGDNVGTFFADIDEVEFLSGMAAGAASKTGKLGYIAAHPIPQTLRNINAWTLGAQSVNPKITTTVVWTGSWSDPAKEAEASNTFIDGGADVLSMHVDGPITVAQTAEKRGVMVCGYHADASKFAPKGWLVGAAWNWAPMMTKIVNEIRAGTYKPGHLRGKLGDGFVKLTSFGPNVSKEIQEKIKTKEAAFKKGDALWAGPFKKQDGTDVVKAGETMTIDKIESMDFMVLGVTGTVK